MPSIKYYLSHLIFHDEPEAPPPITTRTAVALLVLYALSYFLPFYVSSRTRPSPNLSRDAPSVIRARITSVTLSCFACCLATYLILTNAAQASAQDALHLMGFWPVGLQASLKLLFLTAALFTGPLFNYFVVESGWREWMKLSPAKEVWTEWTAWRNIVAGPLTEEVLFRTASIPLMLVARTPLRQTVFLSPVIFGLAHIHHFYEFRLANPQVPVPAALARSVFQFAYTTLFGTYATFAYIRTGSLLGVCLVHAFCNCMGLPRLWGLVRPSSPGTGTGTGTGTGAADGARRTSVLGWTAAYYVLLVGGAAFWYTNLWSLTECEDALVPSAAFSSS